MRLTGNERLLLGALLADTVLLVAFAGCLFLALGATATGSTFDSLDHTVATEQASLTTTPPLAVASSTAAPTPTTTGTLTPTIIAAPTETEFPEPTRKPYVFKTPIFIPNWPTVKPSPSPVPLAPTLSR